jgi:hypothetical protein
MLGEIRTSVFYFAAWNGNRGAGQNSLDDLQPISVLDGLFIAQMKNVTQ